MEKIRLQSTSGMDTMGKNVRGHLNTLFQISRAWLPKMYLPERKIFCYQIFLKGDSVQKSGLSHRYTAIVLIGIAALRHHDGLTILSDEIITDLLSQLEQDLPTLSNLGDVALTLWAMRDWDHPGQKMALEKLRTFHPELGGHPTVEVAWTLDALCRKPDDSVELIHKVAKNLIASFNPRAGIFPHVQQGGGVRSHVACFADQVYPIHSLSNYAHVIGDQIALEVARRCADQISRLQGVAGQWWWHYDWRTGKVIEPYPVYSVHQHAMAPMALFALEQAGKCSYMDNVVKGLEWIFHPPEVKTTLLDSKLGLVWRKVGRREPQKGIRRINAILSWIHPDFRLPNADRWFPPTFIDQESRPYEWGWFLYAWANKGIHKATSE